MAKKQPKEKPTKEEKPKKEQAQDERTKTMAALTQLEITTINRGINVCKQLLSLAEELQQLNDLYESGAGSVKASITANPDGLAAETQYSGMTQGVLDDGLYAAEATIRTAIETARVQLTKLASRKSYTVRWVQDNY